jgi:hypothetical protein
VLRSIVPNRKFSRALPWAESGRPVGPQAQTPTAFLGPKARAGSDQGNALGRFSALQSGLLPFPRALPWAESGRPVGPQTKRRRRFRAEGPYWLSPGHRPGKAAPVSQGVALG